MVVKLCGINIWICPLLRYNRGQTILKQRNIVQCQLNHPFLTPDTILLGRFQLQDTSQYCFFGVKGCAGNVKMRRTEIISRKTTLL